MKQWDVGWNIQFKTAWCWVEEGPWWAFWLIYDCCICRWIPAIKFPKWLYVWVQDSGEEKVRYSWKDWYGDLRQWATIAVEMPLQDRAYKYIKMTSIKLDFEQAKIDFPKEWKRMEEMDKRYNADINKK